MFNGPEKVDDACNPDNFGTDRMKCLCDAKELREKTYKKLELKYKCLKNSDKSICDDCYITH